MLNFIDTISYGILIPLAVFMLLAPFFPMPHLVEKLLMLKNGTLNRPIDIFDLFFHIAPLCLLLIKWYRS
ncbi:MAG: RND transporter [Desulfobulbaceae bacterium]|nr:RND transporter [Desulfobulbaceae bacterium]